MTKGNTPPSEAKVRKWLETHGCPLPFHTVRTRFLGAIATPDPSVSPLAVIKELWGAELPVFDSVDEINEMMGVLVQGLWNDHTRHQKRSQPFRLTRLATDPTTANLGHYSLVRLQELDGFIEGLFNGEDAIDLPERAHEAVGHLGQPRGMMAGLSELMSRDPGAHDEGEIGHLFESVGELTRIMETEIHEAVLSCTRARRQMLGGVATEKPTIH